MGKEKLVVDLDPELVERVRSYCEEHDVDVSDVIGELIQQLPRNGSAEAAEDPDWVKELPPITRRLYGIARGAGGREEYRRFLEEKYGT